MEKREISVADMLFSILGMRRSSFVRRRRSEKSGLIKIEPVITANNGGIHLSPINEAAESSIVELSDDLATITFDPDLISTPLKVYIFQPLFHFCFVFL